MESAMQGRSAGGWQLVASTATMIIAALLLVASFFLPYVSATAPYREAMSAMPDFIVNEEADIAVGDLVDISLFEYALMYANAPALGESGAYLVYVPLLAAEGVLSLLALLFAVLRKPIPVMVLVVLAAGLIAILNWDFSDRGIITGERYVEGVAHWTYLAGIVLSMASAVWLLVLKVRAKRGCTQNDAFEHERHAS